MTENIHIVPPISKRQWGSLGLYYVQINNNSTEMDSGYYQNNFMTIPYPTKL